MALGVMACNTGKEYVALDHLRKDAGTDAIREWWGSREERAADVRNLAIDATSLLRLDDGDLGGQSTHRSSGGAGSSSADAMSAARLC